MWNWGVIRSRWAPAVAVPALVLAVAGGAGGQQNPVAPGWEVMTDRDGEYVAAVEPMRRPYGQGWAAAMLGSIGADPAGNSALAQSIRADEYRGRRVRLTGWVKTAIGDYAGQAGLWMRVDGARDVLVADFMTDRAIAGTRDWAAYTVVLDVPRDAVGITFGLALTGAGQVWLDDLAFEVVGREVPPTNHLARESYGGPLARPRFLAYRSAPARPVNLDFEQTSVIAAR
jgi:hypothetical protein